MGIDQPCIRPMCLQDVPVVLEIERQAYSDPWSEEVFSQSLRVGYRGWCLVNRLEVGETLLGYGLLSVQVGEAHLLNLCIAPAWHGQGFGWKLLETLLEDARAQGASAMFLEVRENNDAAISLYEKAGFYRIGIRKGYYNGLEDALVYRCNLMVD